MTETKPLKITPKPVTMEAMQWLGDNLDSIKAWMDDVNGLKEYGERIIVWSGNTEQWIDAPIYHFIVKAVDSTYFVISDEDMRDNFIVEVPKD